MKKVKRLGSGELARQIVHLLVDATGDETYLKLLEKHGCKLTLESILEAHSDEQRAGFFVLLGHWWAMDKEGIQRDWVPDRLHNQPESVQKSAFRDQIYIYFFGAFWIKDDYGNEIQKPVRTTTTRWDWSYGHYISDQLDKMLYSDLIETVYRLAAESGVVLPQLEKET